MGPIQKQFETVLALFKKKGAKFALAGGYAASLYRKQERFTKDIDFVLWTEGNVIEDAKEILEAAGLKAFEIREAQLKGGPLHRIKRRNTPVWMVAGRGDSKNAVPVDLLFHLFPWMIEALDRAQHNQLDIGFGWSLPVLRVEDVLLSKFMALNDHANRTDDLSDIRDIFSHSEIDLPYLVGRMKMHQIACPQSAKTFVPKIVRAISNEIKKM